MAENFTGKKKCKWRNNNNNVRKKKSLLIVYNIKLKEEEFYNKLIEKVFIIVKSFNSLS